MFFFSILSIVGVVANSVLFFIYQLAVVRGSAFPTRALCSLDYIPFPFILHQSKISAVCLYPGFSLATFNFSVSWFYLPCMSHRRFFISATRMPKFPFSVVRHNLIRIGFCFTKFKAHCRLHILCILSVMPALLKIMHDSCLELGGFFFVAPKY